MFSHWTLTESFPILKAAFDLDPSQKHPNRFSK